MRAPQAALQPLEAYATDAELPARRQVGGKAAGLVWLTREGFDVPPSWIIDVRPFRRLVDGLPAEHRPRALLAAASAAKGSPRGSGSLARMAHARHLILRQALDADLYAQLESLWASVQGDAPWGLAVRSSASCEDTELTSMAGLATSELGVRGPEALSEAVRRVWASAVLPRALAHLARCGVSDFAMAVVIQRVVSAEASGVMFTRPPAGTDEQQWPPDERLINATFGLGAPVVDGAVTPDVVRLAAADGAVRHTTIATKRRALVVGPDGPVYVAVPAERRRAPALSSATRAQLAAIATRLEELQATPHDVEFAVEDDQVRLLQARPVVASGFPEGGDAETVWSRTNVGEALPGAATPLTWSVARGFSEKGFRQAFGSLGCTVPDDAQLVGNVHGRFYLNLSEFMRIAAQVPGLDPRTLLSVGGGSGAALLERQIVGVSRRDFLRKLPRTVARLVAEHAQLTSRVSRFERAASQLREERARMVLAELTVRELAALLQQTLADLDRTGTLMLACASASLASHVALETALRWLAPGDAQQQARVLTAGAGGLDSARVGVAVAKLARLARRTPELAESLGAGRHSGLDDLPSTAGPLRRQMEEFLAEYGDRAVREAELATPRWGEDPAPVFHMLAAAVRDANGDPAMALRRANQKARQQLAELQAALGPVRRAALGALVTHSRRTTELRELMRTWVTRGLGAIRWVACEVDRRMLSLDPDLEPGAAFFCTAPELTQALESEQLELGQLVRLRRAEHARDQQRPDPPATFVGYPPPVVMPPAGGRTLQGLAASSGVVEGPVRLMQAGQIPDALEPGEILVARTTDVGLTPLFLVAAGVVTELGGPLSHAALVAREYGVPAVVNVTGVTVALHQGQRVRVDGDRGTVELLDDAAASA